MMKIQWRLLLGLLFMGGSGLFLPQTASAFSCTSNGVSIGGAGTFTIPVDVTLDKTSTEITLTNMAQYTECLGYIGSGYFDALKIIDSQFSPKLESIGFSGFSNIWGEKHDFPLPNKCIWPDGNCRIENNSFRGPINLSIGMKRLTVGQWDSSTIPAGTELARFTVIQRGSFNGVAGAWGAQKNWIFILRNTLVMPAYACTVNTPNLTISLPAVQKADLQNNGAGRYPAETPFSLNLTCEPKTTVSVQFDGTTMSGKDDVLANTSSGNDATGIQVLFKNNPVKYGQKMQVIANAQAQEQLPFTAHYYYNGGDIKAGPVTSVTTFTFTYN